MPEEGFSSSKSKPSWKIKPPQTKSSPLYPANVEPPPPFIFQTQNGQPPPPLHHLEGGVEAIPPPPPTKL